MYPFNLSLWDIRTLLQHSKYILQIQVYGPALCSKCMHSTYIRVLVPDQAYSNLHWWSVLYIYITVQRNRDVTDHGDRPKTLRFHIMEVAVWYKTVRCYRVITEYLQLSATTDDVIIKLYTLY